MKKYAVIGDPIKHSLSPVMQNAGIDALGEDAEYIKVHVTEDGLDEFVEYAKKELSGFNITVPHKKNIIPYLDEISDAARLSESVNTVKVNDGKLSGTSTDGYGLKMGIKEAFDIDVPGQNFCFVGCGGAVQAVAFYFASCGIGELSFINRTVSKAEKLVVKLSEAYSNVNFLCCSPKDESLIEGFINNASVVIQGTSLGLNADDPCPLDEKFFNDSTYYYDTIYKKTKFLKYASEAGAKTADGRSMLLYQGAKALSIWTGKEAPVELMRDALYSAIS